MKKCTRKRDSPSKVVVLGNKPVAFLTSWLPSPSSLLKLPNRILGDNGDELGVKGQIPSGSI